MLNCIVLVLSAVEKCVPPARAEQHYTARRAMIAQRIKLHTVRHKTTQETKQNLCTTKGTYRSICVLYLAKEIKPLVLSKTLAVVGVHKFLTYTGGFAVLL